MGLGWSLETTGDQTLIRGFGHGLLGPRLGRSSLYARPHNSCGHGQGMMDHLFRPLSVVTGCVLCPRMIGHDQGWV